MAFLDLFSAHASSYAAARPSYPDELFAFIAELAPRRVCAWDCATGNGQAAVGLARWFDRVIATDASAEQIALATPVRNVEYRVAPAEASGLDSASVDLVSIAQALHWVDHDRFYPEVRRVCRPGGVLAAWCYGYCHAGEDLEGILREFEEGTVGPYWQPQRRWVVEEYRTIPFPFPELPAPTLWMRVRWTLAQLGGYLATWSAVQSYRQVRGQDPVPPVLEQLARHWGDPQSIREVVWPIGLRVGRVQ